LYLVSGWPLKKLEESGQTAGRPGAGLREAGFGIFVALFHLVADMIEDVSSTKMGLPSLTATATASEGRESISYRVSFSRR